MTVLILHAIRDDDIGSCLHTKGLKYNLEEIVVILSVGSVIHSSHGYSLSLFLFLSLSLSLTHSLSLSLSLVLFICFLERNNNRGCPKLGTRKRLPFPTLQTPPPTPPPPPPPPPTTAAAATTTTKDWLVGIVLSKTWILCRRHRHPPN